MMPLCPYTGVGGLPKQRYTPTSDHVQTETAPTISATSRTIPVKILSLTNHLTQSLYPVHSRAQVQSADIFHLDESCPRGYRDGMECPMNIEKRAQLIRKWMVSTEMIVAKNARNEGDDCTVLIEMRNDIEQKLPADLVTALKAFFA